MCIRDRVKSGDVLNIDPAIEIDYIALIISAIDYNGGNFSYTFNLSDGYEEDFIISDPYPNPISNHNPMKFDFQVISPQSIKIDIYNILGQNIMSKEAIYSKPIYKIEEWNLRKQNGEKISNGVYIIKIQGQRKHEVKKITYLK